MSKIKIEETDFLWKFYKKSYASAGEPLKQPRSLCPYFWTAMHGLFCYYLELGLGTLALCFVGLFGLGLGLTWLSGETVPALGILIIQIPVLVTFVTIMSKLVERFDKWLASLGEVGKGRVGVGMLCLLVAGATAALSILVPKILQCTWDDVLKFLGGTVVVIAVTVGIVAGIVGLGYGITLAAKPVSTWRFTKQVFAFLWAAKKRVCPLVEPPEGVFNQPAPEVKAEVVAPVESVSNAAEAAVEVQVNKSEGN